MPGEIYGWKEPASKQYKQRNSKTSQDQTEEPFNDRVIEIIERSLKYGPELINTIQSNYFGKEAQITQHQRNHNVEWDRQPDFTVVDSQSVIAFESKRGAAPNINQLEGEYEQLVDSYPDRETKKVVLVTEDISRPGEIDRCDGHIEWLSWYDISYELSKFRPKKSAHEEQREIFKTVLKLENMYSEFTGFEDAHPRQVDYFIRGVKSAINQTTTFEEFKYVDRRPKDFDESVSNTWRPIGQKYHELALYRPDWRYYKGWSESETKYQRLHPCIIINLGNIESTAKIYTGISANPHMVEEIEVELRKYRNRVPEIATNERLGVIFAENTLTHTNPEADPNIHTPDEVIEWDDSRWGQNLDYLLDSSRKDYRRIIFYKEISGPPESQIRRTVEAVEEISDAFVDEFSELCQK